jgi:hypothetical protein
VNARASGGQVRAVLLGDAQSALRTTHQVALPSGDTLAVDDSALAAGIETTDAGLDAALARVNAQILLVSRIGSPAIDAATADARLRPIVEQQSAAAASANPDLIDALSRLILRFVSGLRGPAIGLAQLWPFIGTLGIAVILFILATLGRGLPERVRGEVLVRGGPSEERADPATHLRAADAALSSARARDAIHAFFLYAITALAARETIRYDPALTDSELLVRAAAIPHADALRDLVGIYERSWFGLRDPSVDEARRARELALRVAP